MARDQPVGAAYHVYTRAFDQCLHARELINVIGKISPDMRRGFAGRDDFDWHENVVAFEQPGLLETADFADLNFDRWPEFAITFLVDQSGSSQDDRLIDSVRAVWEVASWLTTNGAAVEVLGFTTAGWHGGFAREQWVAAKRPKYPGRIAALLHVVYKAFSETAFDHEAWRVILHPDARRENIDGEALEWAVERLTARAEACRMLVVVSDGSPVDDATLMANGPAFLDRHLVKVIADIQSSPALTLVGVGVGHDVSGWYENQLALLGEGEPVSAVARFVLATAERCILDQG